MYRVCTQTHKSKDGIDFLLPFLSLFLFFPPSLIFTRRHNLLESDPTTRDEKEQRGKERKKCEHGMETMSNDTTYSARKIGGIRNGLRREKGKNTHFAPFSERYDKEGEKVFLRRPTPTEFRYA